MYVHPGWVRLINVVVVPLEVASIVTLLDKAVNDLSRVDEPVYIIIYTFFVLY